MLNLYFPAIVYLYIGTLSILSAILSIQFIFFLLKRIIGIYRQDKGSFKDPLYRKYFMLKSSWAYEAEKELIYKLYNEAFMLNYFGRSTVMEKKSEESLIDELDKIINN